MIIGSQSNCGANRWKNDTWAGDDDPLRYVLADVVAGWEDYERLVYLNQGLLVSFVVRIGHKRS